MCNYENFNLFIPQSLIKSLAAVGSYCGREGRADAMSTPSRVYAPSHNIFAQKNEFIKINQCVLKKEIALFQIVNKI